MTTILDGLKTSKEIKQEIAAQVAEIVQNGGRKPHLAAILVGEDGASQTYVNAKVKDCGEVGFDSTLIRMPESTTTEDLIAKVKELNTNDGIDGYIVQLPLPKHIDEDAVNQAIDPAKDVDGFHPENIGKMVLGLETFLPATPYGIMMLLERYNVETSGKNCVVLGRSNIVGTPMSLLLSRGTIPGNCTVTLCHSRTQDLDAHLKNADIIVAALGIPEFLKGEQVKEGAAIIDVGITRVADASKKSGYRLAGDVNYKEVAPKASFITPVPGGVGPMTRVALMMNTLLAYQR